MVVITTIGAMGVQTTSLLAVLGAAGLAIGLALQGSLSNFASGVLIVAFRPYKVGDFIEGGGVSGSVEEVQIFTTVLKTPDNKQIIVPNSQIMNGTITNFSAHDIRRVDLVVGCGYDDNLDTVYSVLKDIVDNHPLIIQDPAPGVDLNTLADSSVNFNVRPVVQFAATTGRCTIRSQSRLSVSLTRRGSIFPTPRQTCMFTSMTEALIQYAQ